MEPRFRAGERFRSSERGREPTGGIWAHLGWKILEIEPGRSVIGWEPDQNHSFPAGDGWIVHGGMVTTLLDTAMGQATWTLLDEDEVFLTADLHAEFYRPTRPGPVRAEGRVTHKTKRITFAAANLYGPDDKLLAGARATNVTLTIGEQPTS